MELYKQIALQKAQAYCVYQDRSHKEVRTKLLALEIYGDDLEELMSLLIQDKFLDELRFACSFARGKFRIKKWGRKKITQHLKQHDVSDYCLRKAMLEIDESDYMDTLHSILEKKYLQTKGLSDYQRRQKTIQYALSRGFEYELILEQITSIQE